MKKLIVAIAALAMFAGSAYAADWEFYGNARVATFYSNTDVINGASGSTVFSEGVQGNSRIGANIKVSDELSGRFEYGTGVNVRLLYGVWNFGAGTLLVGQDYTPIRFPGSNQVYGTDNGLGGMGELGSSRAAQLKLRFGSFQVAFVAPNTDYAVDTTNATALVSTDSEVKIPSIQAKYIFSGDNWQLGLVAGYQTFDVENTNASDDITSYILGAGGSISFGAITLGANVHGGQNAGNISTVSVNSAKSTQTSGPTVNENDGMAFWDGLTVVDNDSIGFKLTAAYAVNDMFSVEVGYGAMETEYDGVANTDDNVESYYIQAPITLAPGVMVVPEVGVVDYDENTQKETTYAGAKWQINF